MPSPLMQVLSKSSDLGALLFKQIVSDFCPLSVHNSDVDDDDILFSFFCFL